LKNRSENNFETLFLYENGLQTKTINVYFNRGIKSVMTGDNLQQHNNYSLIHGSVKHNVIPFKHIILCQQPKLFVSYKIKMSVNAIAIHYPYWYFYLIYKMFQNYVIRKLWKGHFRIWKLCIQNVINIFILFVIVRCITEFCMTLLLYTSLYWYFLLYVYKHF